MRQGNNNNHSNNSNNNNNNNRRQRGRNNRRNNNNQPNRNQVYDSNGPGVRVRGNAQQVMEKYIALARDAQAGGNHVQAEAYFQHGEHYLRIHLANQAAIEETRVRRNAQREERQSKNNPAESDQPETRGGRGNNNASHKNASDQPVIMDEPNADTGADVGADGDNKPQAEAEVTMTEATVERTDIEPQPLLDPSEQDQPDIGAVEIVGMGHEGPEAISLIPESNDEDDQPQLAPL